MMACEMLNLKNEFKRRCGIGIGHLKIISYLNNKVDEYRRQIDGTKKMSLKILGNYFN